MMKTDDELFIRDTVLFANTVESVISLQPEEDKKRKIPPVTIPKIKWHNKITCIMYHPLSRIIHKPDKPYEEDFRLIVRTKETVMKAAEKKAAAAAAAAARDKE
uniref:Signal recognition particle protein n=1 Tax=Panagrellus redivivus TaxID=6233 RepID=A0A7E4UWP6_PANRE